MRHTKSCTTLFLKNGFLSNEILLILVWSCVLPFVPFLVFYTALTNKPTSFAVETHNYILLSMIIE